MAILKMQGFMMKHRTIGIIMAVLFLLAVAIVGSAPYLSKRYHRYRCAQNLKTLGKVHTVYSGDCDDEYAVQGSASSPVCQKGTVKRVNSKGAGATLYVYDANTCVHEVNDLKPEYKLFFEDSVAPGDF